MTIRIETRVIRAGVWSGLVLGVALSTAGCASTAPAVRAGLPPQNTPAFAHHPGTIDIVVKGIPEKRGKLYVELYDRADEQRLTFAGLLSEVRKQRATLYLDDRKLTVSEVGFLVGYSEPSAFHRAFRRWTGKTPQAYRARLPT